MAERKIKQRKIKQSKYTPKHCNIFVTKVSLKFNNTCKSAWLYIWANYIIQYLYISYFLLLTIKLGFI